MAGLLAQGTHLGGYRIEGLLGRGGMGVVYEATQLSLNRRVALKLLSADLSADASFRARFQREGRLHAAIDHAHIVPIYDSGDLGDEGLYIAMRLVRGPNLKELMLAGAVEPQRVLRILGPVADALDTAHEARLVHRDIKPQNILVGPRDHGYLADFGLTRAPEDTAFTKTGHFVGTLDYIAPEQIRGEQPGPSSDAYSFAAVVFECLTGSVPFPRSSDAAILFAHVSDDPPRASSHAPALAPVDELLVRAMAKAPEDRPTSLTAFVQELAVALPEGAPAPPPQPPARGESRSPSQVVPAREEPRPIDDAVAAEPVAAVSVADGRRTGSRPAAVPPEPTAGEPTEQRSRRGLSTVTARRRPRAPAGAPAAPDAEQDLAPGRRRVPVALLALATVAVAASAGLGALVAGDGDGGPAGDQARRSFQAGALILQAPPAWSPVSAPASVDAVALRSPKAYAPSRSEPAGLIAGTADGEGESLLAPGLLRTLDEVPEGRPVRMGRLEALRYAALRPREAPGAMTLLAVPTTEGVSTVVCLGSDEERAACEDATRDARTRDGVEALGLGPRASYATSAAAVLRTLATGRSKDRKAFLAAGRRTTQAEQAARLSRRYVTASRAFARLPAGPRERPAQRRISAALADVAESLQALRRAASGGREEAYATARLSVRRREDAVRRAVRTLADIGYRIR